VPRPGRSHRTPFKHSLVDPVLGAYIGSARHWLGDLRRIVLVDLTSGDGDSDGQEPWFRNCSLGLLAYHAMYHVGVPVEAWFFEKAPATYKRLLSQADLMLPALKCPSCGGGWEKVSEGEWRHGSSVVRIRRRDSRTLSFRGLGRGDAVFLNNDPNNISGHAVNSEEILAAIDRGAVIEQFWAMGCNVGGLHRLERSERLQWFEYVGKATAMLSFTQDAYLAAIDGDDARWGYLLISASAWEDRWRKIFGRCFTKYELGPMFASFKSQPEAFYSIQEYLFLTNKERG
jgi:hypothetical protein